MDVFDIAKLKQVAVAVAQKSSNSADNYVYTVLANPDTVLALIALLERLARAANAVNEAATRLYKEGKMQPLCDAQLELVLTDCERAGVVLN